jgi:hypothetical protein
MDSSIDRPPRLRYFTPVEANAVLPRVRGLVQRAADCAQQVRATAQELRERPELDHERLARDIERLRAEINDIVEHIAAEGVLVKGIEPALLDFPALLRGREVLLCWRSGEAMVGWWHDLHNGYANRQPVDFEDLGPWEWCN